MEGCKHPLPLGDYTLFNGPVLLPEGEENFLVFCFTRNIWESLKKIKIIECHLEKLKGFWKFKNRLLLIYRSRNRGLERSDSPKCLLISKTNIYIFIYILYIYKFCRGVCVCVWGHVPSRLFLEHCMQFKVQQDAIEGAWVWSQTDVDLTGPKTN